MAKALEAAPFKLNLMWLRLVTRVQTSVSMSYLRVTRVPSPLPMWYLTPVHEPSSSSLCLHSSPHLGKDRGARVAFLALSQSEMARGNSTQALYLARVMEGRTRRVQAAMAAVDGRRRGTL